MRRACILFLGLVLILASAPSRADDWPAGPDRRVLGGHHFQPLTPVRDPFVTTHLQTVTGVGIATGLEAPFRNAAGDTLGTLDGDIAFFQLEMEYQLNLFDRASVMLSMSGTGRSGIDDQALLADGLTTIYGLVLEGKAVAWRDARNQVTAVARFARKNLFGIDPFGFAQRIIEEGELTKDNELVQEGDVNRGALGVSAARGIRPWLGLSGFVLAGSAQPILDDDSREWFTQTGAALSFDLDPLRGLPLGLGLSYDFDSFPEGGGDVARGIHRVNMAVSYTGRDDFHCGLEIAVATLKQSDIENTLAATTFGVNLRYYF